MKLLLKIAFLYTFVIFCSLTTKSYAIDTVASDSGKEVTENLKERLIETINEVSEKPPEASLFGYVGKVKDIVQTTIIVEDKSGKQNVLVKDDTDIVRTPGNADIKLESVKIDDGVIAIGEKNDTDGEIAGKRIIVSDTLFIPPKKTSGLGTITKISKSTITIEDSLSGNSWIADINSKTLLKSSSTLLDLDEFSVGDRIIFTASVDDEDSTDLTATVIMLVSKKTIDAATSSLEASSPASPVASPKASSKSSPTPRQSPKI